VSVYTGPANPNAPPKPGTGGGGADAFSALPRGSEALKPTDISPPTAFGGKKISPEKEPRLTVPPLSPTTAV
jgi:hypothetical protein